MPNPNGNGNMATASVLMQYWNGILSPLENHIRKNQQDKAAAAKRPPIPGVPFQQPPPVPQQPGFNMPSMPQMNPGPTIDGMGIEIGQKRKITGDYDAERRARPRMSLSFCLSFQVYGN